MLIDTIVITKNAGGGFTRLINGAITREFDSAHYYTRADGVRLLNGDYTPMLSENVAPEKWTVAGNTGFTTNAEVTAALDELGIDVIDVSGGGFKTVLITGNDNTDYEMPSDCDISAPFIHNNVPYSAELLLVSGVKTIRFSEVLTTEQFTTVAYTPTVAAEETARKKLYTAYWTQTGTNAPTVVELEDDIEPVIERSAAGTYTATKTGAFVENRTVPIDESFIDPVTGNKLRMVRTSADVMTITTYLAADLETPADGVLSTQYIHFETFS